MKKLFVILLAVVAVFGLTSCKSNSPSKVVDNYYKALQAGDYQKAMTYTDLVDQEEIQKQIEKYQGFDVKIISYEVVSETIAEDGNTAEVEVKQSATSSFNSEPKEDTKTLKLVKVDGKWKIHA
ncbi:MAG: DUF4878 domain-containing protein [Bacteroidales bacterium]|nr:DUF4878 domain-containing protein [Bacteroidales bacterium]